MKSLINSQTSTVVRWSLGMDKQFNPTLYNECNYLSMLCLKLNHVNKMGPSSCEGTVIILGIFHTHTHRKWVFSHTMYIIDLVANLSTLRYNFNGFQLIVLIETNISANFLNIGQHPCYLWCRDPSIPRVTNCPETPPTLIKSWVLLIACVCRGKYGNLIANSDAVPRATEGLWSLKFLAGNMIQ